MRLCKKYIFILGLFLASPPPLHPVTPMQKQELLKLNRAEQTRREYRKNPQILLNALAELKTSLCAALENEAPDDNAALDETGKAEVENILKSIENIPQNPTQDETRSGFKETIKQWHDYLADDLQNPSQPSLSYFLRFYSGEIPHSDAKGLKPTIDACYKIINVL